MRGPDVKYRFVIDKHHAYGVNGGKQTMNPGPDVALTGR